MGVLVDLLVAFSMSNIIEFKELNQERRFYTTFNRIKVIFTFIKNEGMIKIKKRGLSYV